MCVTGSRHGGPGSVMLPLLLRRDVIGTVLLEVAAEVDCTHAEHGSSRIAPPHAGALHAVLDQILAGSLDSAARDGLAGGEVSGLLFRRRHST